MQILTIFTYPAKALLIITYYNFHYKLESYNEIFYRYTWTTSCWNIFYRHYLHLLKVQQLTLISFDICFR